MAGLNLTIPVGDTAPSASALEDEEEEEKEAASP